jgi:flagellar biosynthesis/type III secretory pathway protein FliH
MTDVIGQIREILSNYHVLESCTENIVNVVQFALREEHKEGYDNGYEQGRIDTHDASYTEGFDEGKTQGITDGRQEVYEEIENNADIEFDMKQEVLKALRGET